MDKATYGADNVSLTVAILSVTADSDACPFSGKRRH